MYMDIPVGTISLLNALSVRCIVVVREYEYAG